MSPTEAAEQRIMAPVLSRITTIADQARRTLVEAHVQGKPAPGLDRMAARMISAMRQASAAAVQRTDGLTKADVKDMLDWRISRLKAAVKAIKGTESPSLGLLLSTVAQVTGLGAGLQSKVSDTLVGQHTAGMEAAASSARDEVLIFQPERDACVRCLKYAGRFRAPGELFPPGLSFDPNAPKAEKKAPGIPGPPIHPSCRCSLEVIPAESAPSNAAALKREAERSILKGWALESESDAVRTRAAKDLLASGIVAPQSVLKETRKRLTSGAPFIRDVP